MILTHTEATDIAAAGHLRFTIKLIYSFKLQATIMETHNKPAN